jgi:cell wall-associated NlpC family hydrolase
MKIADAARKYLGTPFRHRGRGRYLDCAGLVVKVSNDLGIPIQDQKHYGREPFRDGLVEAAERAFGQAILTAPVRLSQVEEDDVLLIRYAVNPHHAMIVGRSPQGWLTVIHADGHYGKVIEHRLGEELAANITHVFRSQT